MAGSEGWSRILHRQDERGVIVESRVFGSDDEIPDSFGSAEYTKVDPVTAQRRQLDESKVTPWGAAVDTSAAAVEEPSDDTQPPPQGGPGSGKAVWEQYAAANGVEVPEDATRDDIIEACEAAGVPVD